MKMQAANQAGYEALLRAILAQQSTIPHDTPVESGWQKRLEQQVDTLGTFWASILRIRYGIDDGDLPSKVPESIQDEVLRRLSRPWRLCPILRAPFPDQWIMFVILANLRPRIVGSLIDLGINSVWTLRNTPDNYLLGIHGVGKKTLEKIRDALSRFPD